MKSFSFHYGEMNVKLEVKIGTKFGFICYRFSLGSVSVRIWFQFLLRWLAIENEVI